MSEIGGFTQTIQSIEDGIYRVTLNRPQQKNAFTPTMYREVKEAVLVGGGHPDVDVIVVEGSDGVFSSGGDLKTLLDVLDMPRERQLQGFIEAFDENMPFQAMLDCPKPVIAKIEGLCLAAGLILASVADATIASDTASFGVPEGLVGVVDAFCPVLLPAAVGVNRARYLMTSGARIDARTAQDWGLVLKAVPADDLESTVREIAAQFARVSPDARRLYKRAVNASLQRVNSTVVLEAALTPNGLEGLAAFRDKREPKWVPTEVPL